MGHKTPIEYFQFTRTTPQQQMRDRVELNGPAKKQPKSLLEKARVFYVPIGFIHWNGAPIKIHVNNKYYVHFLPLLPLDTTNIVKEMIWAFTLSHFLVHRCKNKDVTYSWRSIALNSHELYEYWATYKSDQWWCNKCTYMAARFLKRGKIILSFRSE